MVWFDHHKVWTQYDDLTFAEWAQTKVRGPSERQAGGWRIHCL